MGILLLAERGSLDLMAPAAEYLAEIEECEAGRPITVRDLLWHTSGLPDYLEAGAATLADRLCAEYVNSRLPACSRQARPGRSFSYSSTNYFVRSRVIEAVSGLGFGEFVGSNLAAPFGLQSTFVLGGEFDPARIARGYRDLGSGLPSIEPADDVEIDVLGDGGVHSSLADLIRWQSLLWNGGVVSEGSLRAMRTPGELDSGERFEYGFGLQVEERGDGRAWCGHGGSWTSSTVLVGRYLKERASVIVLSNEVIAPVERIAQRAFALSSRTTASRRPASRTTAPPRSGRR